MTTTDASTNGHAPFDDDRNPGLPPHSNQAEEAVLGSLLKNPAAVRLVCDALEPKDFYLPKNQAIWQAALALEKAGTPIDYHMLADMLERQGNYESSGGLVYLAGIGLATPTAAHIAHYAKIVLRKAIQRRLISMTQHLAEAAWRDDKDPDDLIDEMMRRMARLTARASEDGSVDLSTTVETQLEVLSQERAHYQTHDHAKGEYMTGWKTGLGGLDRALMGMKPGDLIYLAARTSVGKSILAQQIAMEVANHGGAVYYASLEMNATKLLHRAITMVTGVPRHELARGNVSDAEFAIIQKAADRMRKLRWRWDSSARTVEVIRRRAMRWSDEIQHPVALIVVDYVQLLRDQAGPRANRYENVSAASHALKEMAEALECTVLAPAQVGRAVMNRANKMPDLSDLRESGDLEQDSDVVLGLDRANYHDPNSEDLTATLAILKARDLAAGKGRGTQVPLVWLPKYERYGELDQRNVVPFQRRTTILPDDQPQQPPRNGHEQEDLPF